MVRRPGGVARITHKRLIACAGVVAWLMVGLPAFIYHANAPTWNRGWVAAFAVFGAAFAADLVRPRLWLLAAESVAALVLILYRCNGFEGALLVVLAMQLGPRLGRNTALVWIGLQTALLAIATAERVNPRAALLLAPPYLGAQLLAFFVFHIMAREAQTRQELTETNAELRALQQLLAHSTRIAERLRIAHELHDALGHRLTALSLNLEAVLHAAHGAERGRVELCRSLTRDVLNDVRAIVAESKTDEGLSLVEALAPLTAAVPRPRVHLDVAEGLQVCDPEAAHVLFRCVQEITTNAVRHSGAENLWIALERENGAVRLRAHDDGRGSAAASAGFGLRGMRTRIEGAGGEIRFVTQPGQGFAVTALLPLRGGA